MQIIIFLGNVARVYNPNLLMMEKSHDAFSIVSPSQITYALATKVEVRKQFFPSFPLEIVFFILNDYTIIYANTYFFSLIL